jgi:hypothetical protein
MQYLSRRYAPIRVTQYTRIAGGLFEGIDCPMQVVGRLDTGTMDGPVMVAKVVDTTTLYVLRDVEWFDPEPKPPREFSPEDSYWRRKNGHREELIG